MSFLDRAKAAGRLLVGSKMQGAYHRAGDIIVNTHTGDWFPDGRRGPATRVTLVKSTPVQGSVRLISTSVANLVNRTLYIVDGNDERVEPTAAQADLLRLFRRAPNEYEDANDFLKNVVAGLSARRQRPHRRASRGAAPREPAPPRAEGHVRGREQAWRGLLRRSRVHGGPGEAGVQPP